ncbi:MAG TPA: flagellar hook-basal body protein [Fimbriimonadaceae bacterium]|nr:flagellar hook-basal body protein [Fimbriimonadaceae bacterium]
MQRGLEASAFGMTAAQNLLDVVSNNLANVSTTAFKRDGAYFNDVLQRAMYADDGHYLGVMGAGGGMKGTFTVMQPGAMQQTGNPLDVAIQSPDGFFAVQAPGGVRYTRNGSFTLNADRELVTQEGLPVLDAQERTITVGKGHVSIDGQGNVMVDGNAESQIGVFTGVMTKIGSSLYTGDNVSAKDDPSMQSGALEGSNVNAVEEMIAMIQLNRIFEMAQRSAQSQDEMTDKLIQSIRSQ